MIIQIHQREERELARAISGSEDRRELALLRRAELVRLLVLGSSGDRKSCERGDRFEKRGLAGAVDWFLMRLPFPTLATVAGIAVSCGVSMERSLERELAELRTEVSVAHVAPGPAVDDSAVSSRLGGLPYAEHADSWPVCSRCGEPHTFICQMKFDECVHERRPSGLAAFFYCWNCVPWGFEPEDRYRAGWTLRFYPEPTVARYSKIEPPSTPRSELRVCSIRFSKGYSLPDWEGASLWASKAAAISIAANPDEPWAAYWNAAETLAGARENETYVGGYPWWQQGEETPRCGKCSKPMPLLMQVDTEPEAGLAWGDLGIVYLFRCEDHPDIVDLRFQCH